MHPALKHVMELLQANTTLSSQEKEVLDKALKDADKVLVVTEFKLGRFEKEKKSLA